MNRKTLMITSTYGNVQNVDIRIASQVPTFTIHMKIIIIIVDC